MLNKSKGKKQTFPTGEEVNWQLQFAYLKDPLKFCKTVNYLIIIGI